MSEYPLSLKIRFRFLRWFTYVAQWVGDRFSRMAFLCYGAVSWGMDRHFYLWTRRHVGESDDPFAYMTDNEKTRMN